MAVLLFWKNKKILKWKNTFFDVLHEKIMENVEQNNIKLSDNLVRLLDSLDQSIYGAGAVGGDLHEFIETKEDMQKFAGLVEGGIKKYLDTYDPPQEYIDALWEFHQELLKTAEDLK